jgi:Flp pilus assembly pilin Flp
MLRQLLNDESGVIISAELALVLTIAVLAMVVGLSEVAVAVNTELNDISNAIGALDQSYAFTGFRSGFGGSKAKSRAAGTTFVDAPDDCDTNTTCEIVCGAANSATIEGN